MNTISSLLKFVGKGLPQREIVSVGDITIPSSGYVRLVEFAQDKQILSATIGSWSTNTGAFSIAVGSSNTLWAIGTPNTSVTRLNVIVAYMGGGNM